MRCKIIEIISLTIKELYCPRFYEHKQWGKAKKPVSKIKRVILKVVIAEPGMRVGYR